MKTQSNLVRIASRGLSLDKIDFNEIIHKRRADDINFKSCLFETINLMIDDGISDSINIYQRFQMANLYYWLRKNKSVTDSLAETVIKQMVPICSNEHHPEHENITNFIELFQPIYEDESFSIAVFPTLRDCLSVYDLVDFIRGMDSFLNLIIQKHFDKDSNFTLLELNMFIKMFNAKITEEIASKSEMSFMMDESAIQLSFGEVYHAFLNIIVPTFFKDFGLPPTIINSIYYRLLKETPISYVGELIENIYVKTKEESVKKVITPLVEIINGGNEDEAEDAHDKLKVYMLSIVNHLDLEIGIDLYNAQHKLSNDKSIKSIILDLLKKYPKEPHFTIYAINRLLEFKRKYLFSKVEITIYIREMSETCELLLSEDFQCPAEEMRFFVDRMLKNISEWTTFADLSRKLRNNLVTTERNQMLHSLLQECIINNRHASALISFYYAAKIETQYANKLSLINIEEIANRLGATFSITRRFKIAKYIEQSLNEGQLKEQPLEALQQSGHFTLIVNKIMNQKELEYTFDQYVDVRNFYNDYDAMVGRAEYIKRLVTEMDQTVNDKIRDAFKDVLDELNNEQLIHEVLRFAETKVITLLTRELDSLRKDNTLDGITREWMHPLIEQFSQDAHSQYQAEKETRNINIAELYMKIQHYSMMVSVVLGDVRKNYNVEIEKIRNQENFDAVERIQLILGGIAVAKKEDELNFEETGFLTILKEFESTPEKYKIFIDEILSDTSVKIELKDEMGKTRHVHHEHFKETNEIIQTFDAQKLGDVLKNAILLDLLREVADALVSARNMAKNVQELKVTLDDIFSRSADLLEYSETNYNRIMNIEA